VVRDVVVNVVECVRNSEILLPLTVSAAGYLLVRVTRRWGFRPTPVRWPLWRRQRRTRRIGRRVIIPAGRVPRRHRAAGTIGGIKQW
jgi:hypothetical protein